MVVRVRGWRRRNGVVCLKDCLRFVRRVGEDETWIEVFLEVFLNVWERIGFICG